MSLSDWASWATIIGAAATFFAALTTAVAAYFAWRAIKISSVDANLQRSIQTEAAIVSSYQAYLVNRPSFFEGEIGRVTREVSQALSLGYLILQMASKHVSQAAITNPTGKDSLMNSIAEQMTKDLPALQQGLVEWAQRMSATSAKPQGAN